MCLQGGYNEQCCKCFTNYRARCLCLFLRLILIVENCVLLGHYTASSLKSHIALIVFLISIIKEKLIWNGPVTGIRSSENLLSVLVGVSRQLCTAVEVHIQF